MEDDNFSALWNRGRLKKGEGEILYAVTLEAAAPGLGPIADLPLPA